MASSTVNNPIKDLHELLQKKGERPDFDFQEEEDGKKNKVFVCTVKHRDYTKVGRGSSKKIAQHEAAKLLLQTLTSSSSTNRSQTNEVIGNTNSSSEGVNQEQSDGIPEPYCNTEEGMMEDETMASSIVNNPIKDLHELLQKKGEPNPVFDFQEEGVKKNKVFVCTVKHRDYTKEGRGSSKKIAQHEAAKLLLQTLTSLCSTKRAQTKEVIGNTKSNSEGVNEEKPIEEIKANNTKSDSSSPEKNEDHGRYEVKDVAVDLDEPSQNNPMERSVDKSQEPEATQSQDISSTVSNPLEVSQRKESGQSENKSESEQTAVTSLSKDIHPSSADVDRVQDPAAKIKGREEVNLGMSKMDRDCLQEKREFLLESITDVKSLIDGLFSRKIINHRMKEIIEAERTKTDRLRALLDILPRRGSDAFQAFCDVLVKYAEYDAAVGLCPELADKCKALMARSVSELQPPQNLHSFAEDQDELPEGWPDQVKHDPFRINVVPVQKDNVQMQNRFKRAVSGDSHVYPVFHASRGTVLIINNVNFEEARNASKKLSNRDGSDKDKMSLDMLFEQLGFKKRLHWKDCKAQEMLSVLQKQVAEIKNASTFDCFVLVILSHGERGMVYGVDGELVQIDRFVKIMDSPVLVSKPKLLFVQACQGEVEDIGIPATHTGNQETVDQTPVEARPQTLKLTGAGDVTRDGSVPSEADTFLALATVPDYVSWRDTSWGTWFIQAVVYVFSRYAHKYDLLKLMTMVNQLVSHGETYHHKKQISTCEIRLRREFYFFPGLNNP